MGGQLAIPGGSAIVERIGQAAAAKHPGRRQALLEAFGSPRQSSAVGQDCAADPIGRFAVRRGPAGARLVEALGDAPEFGQADGEAGGEDRRARLGKKRRRGRAIVGAGQG